jgi:hypothetical protein
VRHQRLLLLNADVMICVPPLIARFLIVQLRFSEGAAAVVAFSICPCKHGAPLVAMMAVLGCATLACYLRSEQINRPGSTH